MLEKSNEWKLLELFFKKPLYSYHLREICKLLKWSPTKARYYLEILKKEKLIIESKEKNLSLFKSVENEKFKQYKRIYNLMQAFKIAEILEEKLENFDAIVFFGSAFRGDDTERSDFDICIIGSKEVEINLENIEKELNRKISLLFIEDLEELKRKNKELLNNLINGFVISGYLKVI